MQIINQSYNFLDNAENKKLLVKVIQQLNKDFHLANLDYDFDENLKPFELKNKLRVIIEELLKKNYDGYLNLIYRIDLSEKDLNNLPKGNFEKLLDSITFLVLKRIFKKVWLKKHFKKN
ncbi:MAG: hypothetical protein ACWA42_02145 [Lutibacter sp.]